jgi:hypothetical protein
MPKIKKTKIVILATVDLPLGLRREGFQFSLLE